MRRNKETGRIMNWLRYRPCPDCPGRRGRHGLTGGGCPRCGTTGRVPRFGAGKDR